MRNSNRFVWLSVVFCLLLSGISFAEVCLTDEEYQELSTILTTLDKQSIADGKELRMLKSNLSTARSELIGSQVALDTAKTSLDEAEKSLKGQRLVAIIVTVVSSIAAGVIGYGAALIFR